MRYTITRPEYVVDAHSELELSKPKTGLMRRTPMRALQITGLVFFFAGIAMRGSYLTGDVLVIVGAVLFFTGMIGGFITNRRNNR